MQKYLYLKQVDIDQILKDLYAESSSQFQLIHKICSFNTYSFISRSMRRDSTFYRRKFTQVIRKQTRYSLQEIKLP